MEKFKGQTMIDRNIKQFVCCDCEYIPVRENYDNIDKVDVVYIEYSKLADFILNEYYNTCDNRYYLQYALERWLVKNLHDNFFKYTFEDDYYVQIIDKITLKEKFCHEMEKFIDGIKDQSPGDIIKNGLLLEHGFLTKEHSNTIIATKRIFSLKDLIPYLIFSNKKPNIEKIDRLRYRNYIDMFLAKEKDDNIILIDGHHRFQTLLNELFNKNNKTIIYNKESLKNLGKQIKKINHTIEICMIESVDEVQELKDEIINLKYRIENLEYKNGG